MGKEVWQTRIKYLGYILTVYVFVTFFWYMNKNATSKTFEDTVQAIAINGEYRLDSGDFLPIEEVTDMYGKEASMLTIKGKLEEPIKKGKSVFLFVENLHVKILVNDEIVFSAIYDELDPWAEFECQGITEQDNITVELHTLRHYSINNSFKNFIKKSRVTTRFDLLKYQLTRHIPSLFISFIILVIGLSMWINRYQMLYDDKNDAGYRFSGGMVLVLGAYSCFLNYSYITLMTYNVYLLKYFDVMSQSLTCICLASYLRRYLQKPSHKKAGNAMLHLMKTVLVLFMLNRVFEERVTQIESIMLWVMAVGSVLIAAEIICMLRETNKTTKYMKLASYSTILLMGGFFVETIYFQLSGRYFLYIFQATLAIFGLVHYHLISTSNSMNYVKAQKANELENELIQSQIKLMLGQIQPHFLYNALGTIRALVTKSPETAKDALTYFAKYLRANMDSLNEKGCISFKKELEHVESYLHIEKLRFGDKLNVEYDIGVTDFECPPLMLQTMVENAVKHGLGEKADGGTVKISTKETENCYEVKVEDDGVGFDVSKPLDTSRSHIGVDNTRQRVVGMCGGSLSVGSKLGEGTTISIVIPKKNKTK